MPFVAAEEPGLRLARLTGVVVVALVALCFGLLTASAADAKRVKVKGQAVAPPTLVKNKVVVATLLEPRTQKKVRTKQPIAWLKMGRNSKVRAPLPSGGKTKVAPTEIRAGDSLVAKAKVKRGKKGKKGKAKRRAQRAKPLQLKVRKVRIESRESNYTADELADMVFWLAGQIQVLSLRVDDLAATTNKRFADLQAGLDKLAQQVAELDSEGLSTTIQELIGRLSVIETALGDLSGVTDLAGQIAGLADQLLDLETVLGGLTGITELQSSVGSLLTEVGELGAEIETLTDDLGDFELSEQELRSRLDALEGVALPELEAEVESLQLTVGQLCTALLPLVCG